MKTRSKVKLSLIANLTSRRATFRKRKGGIMKKLKELVTLCDVKACAVVYSPFDSYPEVWPSREGVGEVVSRFMELPMLERTKKMVGQEAYLWERIRKGQEQVMKLCDENREFEIREFMFDCLRAKMMEYNHYDARDIQDLRFCIDYYLNELNRRIEILLGNGESSSFNPRFATAVVDVTPAVVANTAMNQYPNQQQSFMDQLMAYPRHMTYVEEFSSIPSMNNNLYRYHQLPTTGHMPSIASTTTADLFAPNINNNRGPTRIDFE